MSVHLDSILKALGRDRHTLYDPDGYSSVRIPVSVIRAVGAGVLATEPTVDQEPDEDLRAAHAEARPPTFERDRPFWSEVVNAMIKASVWVDQRTA